ncbi:hypothetical protein [Spongiactinospora sp. 9N601]|uniref:hypothetical protein n=1 Tax=Spongiactinospora sp. 9N601 TaxID=3375149 RepID=UPI0037B6A4FA
MEPVPAPATGGAGLGGWIGDQITAWFADLVASAVTPLLDVLSVSLLTTPPVDRLPRLWDLWKANAVIANSGYVVLIVAGGILVMGHQSFQTRYAMKEILPRLVIAFLAANTSFVLAAKAIEVANGLSQALLGQDFDPARAARALRGMVVVSAEPDLFYIVLAIVVVILLVLLLMTFVVRVALTALLVIAAPLALACHALPQIDGVARMWWRIFGGLLLIQVCQSLALAASVRIFLNQDGREVVGLSVFGQLYGFLLAIVLLLILVRIPSWIARVMFIRPGRRRGTLVGRVVKMAIAYKLASPVLHALHIGRGGRAAVPARSRAVAARAATAATGPATTATAAAAVREGSSKQAPIAATDHGYPRDALYANGPAGLGQLRELRHRSRRPTPNTPTSDRTRKPAQGDRK